MNAFPSGTCFIASCFSCSVAAVVALSYSLFATISYFATFFCVSVDYTALDCSYFNAGASI